MIFVGWNKKGREQEKGLLKFEAGAKEGQAT